MTMGKWLGFYVIFSTEPMRHKFLTSASVSSGIRAIWPIREKRHAWTISERCGCPVIRCPSHSSFHTRWYHL